MCHPASNKAANIAMPLAGAERRDLTDRVFQPRGVTLCGELVTADDDAQ
jgi:hypothetical protein